MTHSTTDGTPEWPKQVAVLGAGTMGRGIAHVFATAGLPCRLADRSPHLANLGREAVLATAREYLAQGLIGHHAVETIGRSLQAATDVDAAVAEADFVVEAIVEDVAAKCDLLRRIEGPIAGDGVIASNTSAIPIRELARALRRPERFLGTHWFHPAPWIPGVEIVPTSRTDPAVVRRASDLHRTLGKHPVVVSDSAGFVANRLQFALFKEATRLVEEGGVSADQVDAVVRSSFGYRLASVGPFALADMAGLDVYAAVFEQLREHFGERFATPEMIDRAVNDGQLGVKTGRGCLDWPTDRARRTLAERDRLFAALGEILRPSTGA